MSTKRSTPLDDPPSASSSDDETEDEQEITTHKPIPNSSPSSSEESEESEEEITTQIYHENPQFQNPDPKPAYLSTEEESESDSEDATPTPEKKIENPKIVTPNSSSIFEFESDVRSPTASDFAIQPSIKINSVETPDNVLIQKPKRGSSGSESKDTKKIKISNGDADEEKKLASKRVWSEEDELLLLQGFMDYRSKIGCSPLSDMDGFYQFVMNVVPGYASKSQLYEKVRRLKKKFRVNSEKVSGDGANPGAHPVFPKPHERKLFDLSSKIWGTNGCESLPASAATGGTSAKATAKVNAKAKNRVLIKPVAEVEVKVKEKDEDDEETDKIEDFETLYPYWNAGLSSEVSSALNFPAGVVALVKEKLNVIGEAKAKEMNAKWEALFENEDMLRKTRIALLSDVGK